LIEPFADRPAQGEKAGKRPDDRYEATARHTGRSFVDRGFDFPFSWITIAMITSPRILAPTARIRLDSPHPILLPPRILPDPS
jgi:hypothetical protein